MRVLGGVVDLKGKVALVTGGAVRLGRAIALGLAQSGADVAITYNRSGGPADDVVAELEGMGRRSLAVQADFAQASDMAELVDRVVASLGALGVLVNSAAIFEPGEWDTTTEENWDRHHDINLKAPFFLSQAFARHVQAREGHGHIVNIADWRGVRPGTDHVAYTLTKVALVGMTRSLAQALAPAIRVNAIAPGLILPPPGAGPEFVERAAAAIPMERWGSADGIVKAVRYLLDSDFVTGDLLYVTGGEHL